MGLGYLNLPGASGAYASTPDSAALRVTGDLDVAVKVTVSFAQVQPVIVGKQAGGTSSQWELGIWDTAGNLYFRWRESGGSVRTVYPGASLLGYNDVWVWLRATLDVDNGTGGHTVQFWTSEDGSNWSKLGGVRNAGSFTTSIGTISVPLTIGARSSGANPLTGLVGGMVYRNGIDGTVVASPDFTIQPAGARSFTDAQSNVWSINGTASIYQPPTVRPRILAGGSLGYSGILTGGDL